MSAARMFPIHDAKEWADDFSKWVDARCEFHDRSYGGVKCLHNHFSDWCLAESVPCALDTFGLLLRLEGFDVRNGLVYGLILKGDAEFLRQRAGESQ